tara:strand:+ start:15036 stop:15449 length:414 start_codon:yes stop_codon:yes gene_type:complete
MWEFFWFILGVVVYKILVALLDHGKKFLFIQDIKYLALLLVEQSYKEVLFIQTLKYKTLLETTSDEEKIKLHKNDDQRFLEEWKKNAVITLNYAVPPPYRAAIGAKDWQAIMDLLDSYYRSKTRRLTDETKIKKEKV